MQLLIFSMLAVFALSIRELHAVRRQHDSQTAK